MTDETQTKKIIKGNAKKKQKLLKLSDIFEVEDMQAVKEYAWKKVIAPGTKRLLEDVVINTLRMILWGGSGTGYSSQNGRTNYNGIPTRGSQQNDIQPKRKRFAYEDVIVENRADAEDICHQMEDSIMRYNRVSVANLYELAGVGTTPSDYDYGWKSLSGMDIRTVREGFLIAMPPVVPLNN